MVKTISNLKKEQCKVTLWGDLEDILCEVAFTLFENIIPNIEVQDKEAAKMLVERINKLSKEYLKGNK